MRKTLENLRSKPAHIRERIAYMSAAGVTMGVFAVWAVSFVVTQPLSLNTNPPQPQEKTTNPLADLAGNLQTGFAGVAASLEDVPEEPQTQYEGEARLEVVDTYRAPEPNPRPDTVTF